MIVLQTTYTAPLEQVDAHRDAHLAFVRALVEEGVVLAAGRLDPPTGAALICAGRDTEALLERMRAEDPYSQAGVVEYAALLSFNAPSGAPALLALDAA